MTEALKTDLLLALGARPAGAGGRRPPAEAGAFTEALKKQAEPRPPRSLPLSEEGNEGERRIFALLEKMPVPWQRSAETEVEGVREAEDLPAIEDRLHPGSLEPKPEGEDAAEGAPSAPPPVPAAKRGEAPPLLPSKPAPGTEAQSMPIEGNGARNDRPAPRGVPTTAVEHGEATVRPPVDGAPGATERGQSGPARVSATLSAGATTALFRQHAVTAEPAAEQAGADRDKMPLRIVAVQSVPAAAQPVSWGANPTSAALLSDLQASPGFAFAAAEAARAAATAGARAHTVLHTLTLQLHPAELGTVNVRIGLSETQLTVEMRVESPEARQQLNADCESITRALRALGYEVDRIVVQQSQPGSGVHAGSGTAGREAGFHMGAGDGQARGEERPGTGGGNGVLSQRHREGAEEEQGSAGTRGGIYI